MSQRVRGRPASRKAGVLRCGSRIRAARAALHLWEEPCLIGEKGSGAVFFSGCGLRCVFCQNYEIARAAAGEEIPEERLAEIFWNCRIRGRLILTW